MAKSLEQIIADMKAQGITVSTQLADPTRVTPMSVIRDAAKDAGIHYGDDDDA